MSSRTRFHVAAPAGAKQGFVVGSEAFAKISAVEGIRAREDALRRARDFERQDLPAEERRREIIAAHKPTD